MKIELKTFQDSAARQLWRYVRRASNEARDGDLQAIVLSSPTGSGKTVTITQLLEWIHSGDESTPGNPNAVFLWLSDSPELNLQSRDKILRQSSVFRRSQLVVIEPSLNQERLAGGRIYFLNTQKLGKDSLLTKAGDGRDFTIWQTLQNTSLAQPEDFFIIIDEAHRGMTESQVDRARAATIVQRFIKGYPEVGLEPIKLILGMSATPERFNAVIEGSSRTKREYVIDPEDVKASGLLKERIVVYFPDEKQPSDMSLLEESARRWRLFSDEWNAYCVSQKMDEIVTPALVIQVEDGEEKRLTRTNLDEVVSIVERVTGPLPDEAWAHAFQEDKTIEAGGRKIRKVEASQVQFDQKIRVVLFKMSLTTGWDCPRAEVMMSFRKARDYTLIAQLVGRMVRTPLARSIEGQDFLNSVSLYLPHYDLEGLHVILDKLSSPDADTGVAISVEEGSKLVTVRRNQQLAELFPILESLPTYRIDRVAKMSNTRRLMRLARMLTFDEIAPKALSQAKALVVKILSAEMRRLTKKSDYVGHLAANQEIAIRELPVEYGEWKEAAEPNIIKIRATPENIDDLFVLSGRKLGEGLHMEYWKNSRDKVNPDKAKLDLSVLVNDATVWQKLEQACQERLQELFREHQAVIRNLPTGQQEGYLRLKGLAKTPEPEELRVPALFDAPKGKPDWDRHLYVDDHGKYGATLNSWEATVLQEELANPDTVGWYRNVPRKPWSLRVPYETAGKALPCFPDLVVFRRVKGKIVADLLDPHDSGLPDAVDKAKGLAAYAKRHGDQFGRIELIAMQEGILKRLDLTDEPIRQDVLKITSKPHLDKLFEGAT